MTWPSPAKRRTTTSETGREPVAPDVATGANGDGAPTHLDPAPVDTPDSRVPAQGPREIVTKPQSPTAGGGDAGLAVWFPADLREILAAMDGVDRVHVSDDGSAVLLVCEPTAPVGRILQDACGLADAAGLDLGRTNLDVVVSATRRERRVRFDNVERWEHPDHSVSVRVTLEWEGVARSAELTGEKGEGPELRTAAQAALRTVEMVTGESFELRLVGVKQVRAFDGELVVVSIYGGPGRKTLLGVVLAGDDPLRATVIAVLMALNRLLGNYLATR